MYPRLEVTVLGTGQVSRKLLRGAEAAMNMRPVLVLVRKDMYRVIRATFTGQGRRGGGSWTFLTEDWAARKEKMGWDPRILIAQERLMNSLTGRNRFTRSKVTRHDIVLDTTLVYAASHQYGDESRGIPQRKFIDFTVADRLRWVKMCESYLIGAMRG